MNIFEKILPFIIIVICTYFAVQSFFINGFFSMHDDTQVARVFEMQKSLRDGMFPVRWTADLGYNYGYPIFNFYAPLSYYVGGVFNLTGFDSLSATKIMMAIGIILSGINMYLLAKQFWGIGGGIISSLLYLYAPYHAVDIFVRGDVAEFWAYAFIPIIFYGLWMSYQKKNWRYVIIGSLGYAAVITSHNLSAMMVTPFVIIFILVLGFLSWRTKELKNIHYPSMILLFGIILAAFYWLPVFSEMKYTNVLSQVGGGADYRDHFVCPVQLWNSPWGFGGSTGGCVDGLSFKLGKIHIFIFIFAVFSLFLLRKRDKLKFYISILIFIFILFATFLTFSQSQFIWDAISPMAFLQYPWRFLLLIAFFMSFLGGAIAVLLDKFVKQRIVNFSLVALLSIIIIYFNYSIFTPQTVLNKTAADYTNAYQLKWMTSKISDEYMPKGFVKPKNYNEVPTEKIVKTENLKIDYLQQKTQITEAQVQTQKATDLVINQAYFPGWQIYIDGRKTEFKVINKGLKVEIPAGVHQIILKFSQTLIEVLANTISLAGVIFLVLGIIGKRKEIYVKKGT